MRARILAWGLGIGCVIGIGGCVGVSSETATQRDEIGDVEIETVVCAGRPNSTEGSSCPTGNDANPAGSGDFQLLIAYRIPTGVTYPESIAAREGTIGLLYNASLVAELNRLAPISAAAGQQWVAYVSPTFYYGTVDDVQSATLVARFGLLRGANGAPWGGPFRYRTLVGYREAEPQPGRAVSCGATLSEYSEDGSTLCQDWPAAAETGVDTSFATRDLGVISAARGTVARGKSGPVSFTLRYAGDTASPAFSLTAETSVPGGTARPAAPAFTAGGRGETTIPVEVSVPASTAPGVYDIVLAATLPNGQRRSGAGTVQVTGRSVVDRTPPEVNLRVGALPRIARARKVGIAPEVACSEACRLEAELRLAGTTARRLGIPVGAGRSYVTVGRTRDTRVVAGRRNFRVRLTKTAAPRIGRASSVSLTYRVVARDAAGNHRVRSAKLTLRR